MKIAWFNNLANISKWYFNAHEILDTMRTILNFIAQKW